LNLFITFGHVLASALALSFITTWTRDAWDQPLTFVVVKMPSQYLPYAILLCTLIMASPQSAIIQATGLAAGHLYDLLSGLYPSSGIKRNLITTPGWMRRVFGTHGTVDRPYGTALNAGAGEAAWGLDLSWRRFGPGRTLGGEGASVERQRPKGWVLAVMVMGGFVAVCCFLGYLYVLHWAPDGWFSRFRNEGSEKIGVPGRV
jgi:Derlin-2/3